MTFKKYKGQIFGVELTPKERKVLDAEVNKQLIERHSEFSDDVDYMILRILHNEFGFGLSRLKKFFYAFIADNDALVKHYETADAGAYIARKEMKALGCDFEKWEKERSE